MRRVALLATSLLIACVAPASQPARQAPNQGNANLYGQQPPPQQGGWQQQPPPQQGGWQQQPPPQQGGWQQQPPPQQPPQGGWQPPPQQQRPMLAPLVGSAAMQQEVRMILGELTQALPADQQRRVTGIPLQFQSTMEVNAYAGCEKGQAFMATTEGFMAAADAIAQTNATDEQFGTKTYDAYTARVLPQIIQGEKSANPGLPPDIIPPQYVGNPARLSRARELFGDIVAFTFGHELAHHYLGHTGCANGQVRDLGTLLTNLASHVIPIWSQAYESQSDQSGCINALDAGARRRPNYRWSEKGGVLLLDFFARLDRAAGNNPMTPLNLLRSHPNPAFRIPYVQQTAQEWYRRNPQVAR